MRKRLVALKLMRSDAFWESIMGILFTRLLFGDVGQDGGYLVNRLAAIESSYTSY